MQGRFRLMLGQLLDELGSQEEVAKRTGLHQTMVSMVLAGTREIGHRGAERVIERMKIDRRFFTDPSVPNPRYKDFVGRPRVASVDRTADQTRRAVDAFLSGPDGDRVSAAQAEALRTMDFGGVPATPAMVRSVWLEWCAQGLAAGPQSEPGSHIRHKRRGAR